MISLKNPSEKTNKKRLMTIFLVTITGFLVALFYCYIMGHYLGKSYPYDSFLFIASDRHNDYFITIKHTFDTYSSISAGAGYFPFMYITLIPFTLLPKFASLFAYFFVFCLIYFISSYSTLKDENKLQSLAVCLILFAISFPFLFLIDRGNVEATVYVFVLLFIYFYRKTKFTASAVFLAMAISCKFFPVIFSIIYLKDKKYKEFFKVVAFSLIFTLGSFLLLKCDLQMLINNLSFFNKNYFVGNWGLPFSHSLHTLVKAILAFFNQYNILSANQVKNIVNFEISIYTYVVLFFIAILAIYTIVFEKVTWRIITLLTIGMLLFANVSFDYRLIYLMIPIMLFIISNEKLTNKSNIFYGILFGLMLIPKNYYITDFSFSTANIGGIINPLLFIIMIVAIMKDGLKGKNIAASIKTYIIELLPKKVLIEKVGPII